jgi:hypothetical protein
VIQISSNKYGRWRQVDIESLYLEDGRNANDLTVWELQPLLEKQGIPHVKPGMAKPDLLFALGVFQQQQREIVIGERNKPAE